MTNNKNTLMPLRIYTALLIPAILIIASTAALADTIPWQFLEQDLTHARNAHGHAKKGNWKDALLHAKKAKDKTISTFIQWQAIQSGADNLSFSDISTFTENHSNWPAQKHVSVMAEKTIHAGTSKEAIIDWFTENTSASGRHMFRTPSTANGKYFLAEAIATLPNPRLYRTQVDRFIREAWIEGSYSKQEEDLFLKKFQDKLRDKDMIARTNQLLWKGNIAEAQRMLHRISERYQPLFKARIALQTKTFGIDEMLAAVPRHLSHDPGLIFDRVRWRGKNKKENTAKQILASAELLRNVKGRPHFPSRWWNIKKSFIRELLDIQEYDLAYELSKNHGFTSKSVAGFAEAEWLAGWISLRFQENPRAAYRHFYRLSQKVSTPISTARATYWAGRAAEDNHNLVMAKRWYEKAAAYKHTFYGMLAIEKLGLDEFILPEPVVPTPKDQQQFTKNEMAKMAALLHKLGDHSNARSFLKHAIRQALTQGEKTLITTLGQRFNRPDYSVVAGKTATHTGDIIEVSKFYPQLASLKDPSGQPITAPEPALIHAIVRQESIFDPRIRSSAGALGLMQLMPATAKEVAQLTKTKYEKSRLTSDKRYNVMLGSAYLNGLINQHKGSYVLAIASYNAGPGNVQRWIKSNGDPRRMSQIEGIIDWLELIPFAETRNYVQRVLENVQIYRTLLEKSSKLYLATDLKR